MQALMGARVVLTPRPARRRPAALEVAMLGHCGGRVRLDRLRAFTGALMEMRSIGYGAAVDALERGALPGAPPLEPRWEGLFHLPIPLNASAEFHDVFPDAATAGSAYTSLLAGRRAWLAQAVDDFFANGGEKLWIVRIPESEGQAGFLPGANVDLHDVEELRGIETVMVIPALGVVALPDLERLQVPAQLPDVPEVLVEHPDPQFLPCSTEAGIDQLDDQGLPESPPPLSPVPLEGVLRGLLQLISSRRPDVQCLLTLPLAYSGALDSPVVDPAALATVSAISGDAGGRQALRHVQLLFPYLRGPGMPLCSAVGVIAGKQAEVARRRGPWHSIAAQSLFAEALPYPPLSLSQTIALRDNPGLGVLQSRADFTGQNQLSLDDERLVVPALPAADVEGTEPGRLDGFRSAEVMRFLGFLRRELQALGERMVFDLDPRDPRPRLALERFFRQLHQQGALRGRTVEEAYRIVESQPQEGAVQFDIEIAPAFPIDRIFLTFVNLDGEWRAEVGDD